MVNNPPPRYRQEPKKYQDKRKEREEAALKAKKEQEAWKYPGSSPEGN